jgi:cystathionine gamma-synthase
LADYLLDHASVAKVYYPKYTTHYPSLATQPTGYYGGLVSIVLGTHMCQRTFFDALDIAKGPSLGTNFTLMCPYTLLAHYHELDFCLTYNVEPNLLRLSVGLEDFDVLKAKFEQAFTTSKLHPPLPDASQQKQQYLQQQRRGYCTLMAKNNGSASKKRFLRFGLSMGLAVARRI